jgi:hypothetical protein
MAVEWDPVTFINLILCSIIVYLGVHSSRRTGEALPLYIGAAFGLFGVSHALTLLGFKLALTIPLIIVRTLAYLLVIYALYRFLQGAFSAREAKEAWIEFYQEQAGGEKKEKAEDDS